MQKSFFCSSVKFWDNTLIGIDEVFEDTIAPSFLLLNILRYKYTSVGQFGQKDWRSLDRACYPGQKSSY